MKFLDKDVPGPRRDYIGYGPHVPKVEWPDGAHLALALVVNWEEGSEYSVPGGDARNEVMSEMLYPLQGDYRDLFVESVYEYGTRAGIWRIQRLLDELELKSTFSGSAVAFERNPAVAKYVREAGHEVCCHGWRWEELWRLSREEEHEHLTAAIQSIEATCGTRPVGWNSRYTPSVHTRELLVEEGGFVYDSDAYNDDLPYFVEVNGRKHLIVPYSPVYNDSRFIVPQGFSDPSSFVDYCRRGIDILWAEGATHPRMMSIGFHPRIIGQAGRISALREVLEYALEKGAIWFPRRVDIADWWIANHERFV